MNAKKSPTKITSREKPKQKLDSVGIKSTKGGAILNLLLRRQGASLEEMQKASGWQAHSVRGYLSGTVKKRLGLTLSSNKSPNSERRYAITAG